MRGPSPVIPFLLVGVLGLLVCRESLVSGYEFIAKVQDVTTPLLVVALVALILIVGTVNELIIIIIPLAFLLVVFLLRALLVASLLLMLSILFLAKFSHSSGGKASSWERQTSCGDDEDGTGLCWFIFVLLCFIICLLFSEVESYGWISLVFGLASILYFNIF